MKNRAILLVVLIFLGTVLIYSWSQSDKKSSVLVVTGGHAYDTAEFVQMFRTLGGINADTIHYSRIHQPGVDRLIKKYDVLVFYDMWQNTSEADRILLSYLTEKGMGLVFLHHSLVSHPLWPEYEQIIGGKYRLKTEADSSLWSGYKHDLNLEVSVLDPDHPVLTGISDFTIHDEGYSNISMLPTVYPLLSVDHPEAAKYVGWANNYKNSRIVYLMLGHDKLAYSNESFRQLLQNSIQYVSD